MMARYRSPRSGKWSLATALIAPLVLAAGVYMAIDHPGIVSPAPVAPPDTARRYMQTDTVSSPAPMPKTPAVVQPRTVTGRALGPGVFKCVDTNGAVTYSQYPCDDGRLVDTRPTSGGFAEQWSISVKQR